MFNKELTKCDIITIIAGDCQNAEEKFIQISTEFVQAITGAKYLGFFSARSLKTREKYISFSQLVLLSLYIF